MIKLRDYQTQVCSFISKCQSDSLLIVQPTGTGKTVEFMWHAIFDNHRTLVLVYSEELIDQAIKTARLIKPNISIGKFIGKERDLDAQIVVASVQTLKNINNLMLIDRDFTRVICDEAHRFVSDTATRILYAFGLCDLDTAGQENTLFIEPDFSVERKLIGFTATPDRTDEESLGKVFKERLDTPPLEWFIEQGYLCDLKFISVDTGVDMSDVRSYIGDLSEKQMEERFIESGYTNELARIIEEYLPNNKSILIYVPGVKMAQMSANHIQKSGISCDYVVGSERDRRKDVINRFKQGDIRALVNCLVLKEGFDAPCTDAIILCRPSKSKLLLRQIIGRGTRKHNSKNICTVVDLVVKRREEDIISASGVFDELELSPIEQQMMTIKDKIFIQKQKSSCFSMLASVLEEIQLKKEIELDEQLKNKQRKRRQEEVEFFVADVPDSVSMLLDTRLLRVIGLDADEFSDAFTKEQENLNKVKPMRSWLNKDTPHDYQIEFLKQHTSYSEEDLTMLNPVEAHCFISIMKKQTKQISANRKHILTNVYNIPEDKIPQRDIDARRLIKQLYNRRFKHGSV